MTGIAVHPNSRFARLTRLTRDLKQSRTPGETLRVVRRAFADSRGFVASMLLSTRGLEPGCYRVVDAELDDGDDRRHLDSESWDQPHSVHSGGVVASIVSRCDTQHLRGVDWSSDPYFRRVRGLLPTVGMLDLSGFLIFILAWIVQRLLWMLY